MDFFRKRLVWQEEKDKKKYHLVQWDTICQPKEQGCLGVIDLFTMNVCLLCEWLWKIENEEGLWHQMIRAKYLHSPNLAHVKLRAFHSHFWSGLLKVRDIFSSSVGKKLGMVVELDFGMIFGLERNLFLIYFP